MNIEKNIFLGQEMILICQKWEETVEVPCPVMSANKKNEFDNSCSEGKIAGVF